MSGELTIEWNSSSPPSLSFSLPSTQEQGWSCCFPLFKKKKANPRLNELKSIINTINQALTFKPPAIRDPNQVANFVYKESPNQLVITGFCNFYNAVHLLDQTKHPQLLLEQEALSKFLKPTEKISMQNIIPITELHDYLKII